MARTRKEQPAPQQRNVDEHHGHGGSYVIAGGVNHDVESEGPRELADRTEHRVVRSVVLEEQERLAKAEGQVAGESQAAE